MPDELMYSKWVINKNAEHTIFVEYRKCQMTDDDMSTMCESETV